MADNDALKPVDDDHSGPARLEPEFVEQNPMNCVDAGEREEEREDVDALYHLFGELLSRRLAELPERRRFAVPSCLERKNSQKEDDIADNYIEMFARKRRDRKRSSRRGTTDGLCFRTEQNSIQDNTTGQAKRYLPGNLTHRHEKCPRFLEKLRHCFV